MISLARLLVLCCGLVGAHTSIVSLGSKIRPISEKCRKYSETSVSCANVTSPSAIPHPDDCSLFYYCVKPDNRPICHQCPSNLHFSPTLLRCYWQYKAGCHIPTADIALVPSNTDITTPATTNTPESSITVNTINSATRNLASETTSVSQPITRKPTRNDIPITTKLSSEFTSIQTTIAETTIRKLTSSVTPTTTESITSELTSTATPTTAAPTTRQVTSTETSTTAEPATELRTTTTTTTTTAATTTKKKKKKCRRKKWRFWKRCK